ncbi:hypothetical protein ACXWQS_09345, partial [Streptococcus pyogenes]
IVYKIEYRERNSKYIRVKPDGFFKIFLKVKTRESINFHNYIYLILSIFDNYYKYESRFKNTTSDETQIVIETAQQPQPKPPVMTDKAIIVK